MFAARDLLTQTADLTVDPSFAALLLSAAYVFNTGIISFIYLFLFNNVPSERDINVIAKVVFPPVNACVFYVVQCVFAQ